MFSNLIVSIRCSNIIHLPIIKKHSGELLQQCVCQGNTSAPHIWLLAMLELVENLPLGQEVVGIYPTVQRLELKH